MRSFDSIFLATIHVPNIFISVSYFWLQYILVVPRSSHVMIHLPPRFKRLWIVPSQPGHLNGKGLAILNQGSRGIVLAGKGIAHVMQGPSRRFVVFAQDCFKDLQRLAQFPHPKVVLARGIQHNSKLVVRTGRILVALSPHDPSQGQRPFQLNQGLVVVLCLTVGNAQLVVRTGRVGMLLADNSSSNLQRFGHFHHGSSIISLDFEGLAQFFVLRGNLEVGIDSGQSDCTSRRSSSIRMATLQLNGTLAGKSHGPLVKLRIGQWIATAAAIVVDGPTTTIALLFLLLLSRRSTWRG